MFLAIDVGNSDIVYGIHDHCEWRFQWRIPTAVDQPAIFYQRHLSHQFLENDLPLNVIEQVALSSVVPEMDKIIFGLITALFGYEPLVINADLFNRMEFDVTNPYEIGSDLVANALAGHQLAGGDAIVVDFGTALTFTSVAAQGKILGVAIAPGIKTAMKSLSIHTSKLPEIPLEMPLSPLGKNTVGAMQSGILFGYVGLVKEMLDRIKATFPEDTRITTIATGGLSQVLTPLHHYFDHIEPLLTLTGIKLIGEQYG